MKLLLAARAAAAAAEVEPGGRPRLNPEPVTGKMFSKFAGTPLPSVQAPLSRR